MRASAQILGRAVGLTAQELNYALKEAGFLAGEPGLYSLTEKGAAYAAEQHHHRGPGGYSWYNRDWETRTWDDSVLGALDFSDERRKQIQQAVADARRAAREARRAAAAVVADTAGNRADGVRRGGTAALTKAVRPLLAALVAYGIFRAVPLAQKLWNEKTAPGLTNRDRAQLKPDPGEDPGTDDGPGSCA